MNPHIHIYVSFIICTIYDTQAEFVIECWDYDSLSSDDLIGKLTVSLKDIVTGVCICVCVCVCVCVCMCVCVCACMHVCRYVCVRA